MSTIILIFALFVLFAAVVILTSPSTVTQFLQKHHASKTIFGSAVAVRLVVGLVLVAEASQSRFPLTLEVLGWVFILAAIFLLAMRHHNFVRLIKWVLEKFDPYARIGGVIAALFGVFLLHAVT